MNSFSNKKAIRFVITLGNTTFANGSNVITLQGFRASADIPKSGGVQLGECRAKIWGVGLSDMNSIATFNWKVGLWQPNTIEVFAIDGNVESLVFAGNIVNAWADYQSMPDVCLMVQARTAHIAAMKPITPSSFNGVVDVATVMGQLARQAGFAFENNGVSIQMSNIYLPNTGLEQMKDLAHMAPCDIYIDDKVVAICPPNVPRGTTVAVVSAETGMIGYPTFDGYGLNFRTLYNPAVIFGGRIKVTSDVPQVLNGNPEGIKAGQASGLWYVSSLSHNLECEKPGGSWFSTVRALPDEFSVAL